MFTSILEIAETGNVSTADMLICMAVAILLGFILSAVYIFVAKRNRSSSFAISLVILPAVVSIVIMLVGSNVARAFSLAGVFSLIRFRSAPGEAKDISLIFVEMVAGLACGMGYLPAAVLVVCVIGGILVILSLTGYARIKEVEKELRITVPEDLNYQNAFDEILNTYTAFYALEKVKTTNLGSYFELTYRIRVKENADEKAFIDELRCRNGNLKIALGILPENQSGVL